MSDFDSPWKEALDRYFPAFLAFFFPHIHAAIDWSRGYEMLDKELQQVIREAEQRRRHVDKLAKVWRKDGEETWVLIHVEIQSQPEKGFERRMYVYNYRVFDRYNREVVSLAVLADDRADWRPREFHSSLWGCKAGIEFPVVKLLDYAGQESVLEADPNPFATVVLAHLKTLETRRKPETRQAWKLRLVRGLYERNMSRQDVQQLFRFIDWMMDLPEALSQKFWHEVEDYEKEKQMPYVSSIERLAREEGRLEGRLEGQRDGLLSALAIGLDLKFGPRGKKLMPRLRRIKEIATLQAVQQALMKADRLDELRRALP